MRRALAILLPLLAAAVALVPAVVVPSAGAAQPKKKGANYAFLIAAARYTKIQEIKGEETVNDILEFKKALVETGFDESNIVLMHDRQAEKGGAGARFLPEHDKIVKELDLFLDGMKPEDTVVLALSGHGVLFKGDKTGYFCPVDAKLDPREKLIPMDGDGSIFAALEKCKAGRKLLISNTCRDAPTVAKPVDLAGNRIELIDDYPESVPKGIAAIYSCEPKQRSYYDEKRGRSLFFIHLTDAWRGKYHDGGGPLTLEAVFDKTREKTKADANATHGEKQFPVVRRQYEGEWAIAATQAPAQTYTSKTTGMKFVQAKAGKFQMGSPNVGKSIVPLRKYEGDHFSDEGPQREVEITKDFSLGQFEVTRGQFAKFVDDTGYKTEGEADGTGGFGWDADKKDWREDPKFIWRNPGFPQTDEHPVVLVSWNDAVKFCEWLSKKDGRTYRLPSEAEWEYACRAGTKTRFHFGDNEEDLAKYANAADKDFQTATGKIWGLTSSDGYGFTAPVGRFKPNSWGLYDMHGNAWEWCRDYYGSYEKVESRRDPLQLKKQSDDRRVRRGGSWSNYAKSCRAAYRYWAAPVDRYYYLGFRGVSSPGLS